MRRGTGNRDKKWLDAAYLRILWHQEEVETATGTAGTASSISALLIPSAKSCTHSYRCYCFSSDPRRTVRCPSQTEHHPQLHASCHDCSSCSNCLLLLWSLQLRCQGWWLLGCWADGRVGSEPWESCDDPTETFDHKWFEFLVCWSTVQAIPGLHKALCIFPGLLKQIATNWIA